MTNEHISWEECRKKYDGSEESSLGSHGSLERRIKSIGLACVGVFAGLSFFIGNRPDNYSVKLNHDRPIQIDYVNLSKLELKLEDVDFNGKSETIIRYDGKDYLFKAEKGKTPRLIPFSAGHLIEEKNTKYVPLPVK